MLVTPRDDAETLLQDRSFLQDMKADILRRAEEAALADEDDDLDQVQQDEWEKFAGEGLSDVRELVEVAWKQGFTAVCSSLRSLPHALIGELHLAGRRANKEGTRWKRTRVVRVGSELLQSSSDFGNIDACG